MKNKSWSSWLIVRALAIIHSAIIREENFESQYFQEKKLIFKLSSSTFCRNLQKNSEYNLQTSRITLY